MCHLCMHGALVPAFLSNIFLNYVLQVPLLKEQKWRFCGVQHIHRKTPVHRKGSPLRPTSLKLYLVSAASSGWVRRKYNSTCGLFFIILSDVKTM